MTTNRPSNKHMQIDKGKWYRYAEREKNHTECRYISWVFGLLLLTPLSFFLNIIRTCQADITVTTHRTKIATPRVPRSGIAMTTCHADNTPCQDFCNTPNKSRCIFTVVTQVKSAPTPWSHFTRRIENVVISHQTCKWDRNYSPSQDCHDDTKQTLYVTNSDVIDFTQRVHLYDRAHPKPHEHFCLLTNAHQTRHWASLSTTHHTWKGLQLTVRTHAPITQTEPLLSLPKPYLFVDWSAFSHFSIPPSLPLCFEFSVFIPWARLTVFWFLCYAPCVTQVWISLAAGVASLLNPPRHLLSSIHPLLW